MDVTLKLADGRTVVGTLDKEPFALLSKPYPGVCLMTLNRPKTLNAISSVNAYEIYQKVLDIGKDDSVRVLVINANGKGFCSGADLSPQAGYFLPVDEQGNRHRVPPGDAIALIMEAAYNPMIKALYELDKPIVVAAHGVAAGGGVAFALIADICIASATTKFVNVFAPKLGLVPDLGSTWTLPRIIGRARALGMSLLGEAVTGKQAEQNGMIYKCVEKDEQVLGEALRIAKQLSTGPSLAFAETRRMFDKAWTSTFQEQVDEELRSQSKLASYPDYTIGLRKFRGDKDIQFVGTKKWPEHLNPKSNL